MQNRCPERSLLQPPSATFVSENARLKTSRQPRPVTNFTFVPQPADPGCPTLTGCRQSVDNNLLLQRTRLIASTPSSQHRRKATSTLYMDQRIKEGKYSSQDGNTDAMPPWERGNAAQVPYLNDNSRSLSSAERDALPCLWAVHTSNPRPTPLRGDAHTRWASNSSQKHSVEPNNQWKNTPPITALFPPRPDDDSVYIAAGPKSTPYPPTWVKGRTPSDSDKSSCTTISTSGSSPPPPPKYEINALPTIPSGDRLDQTDRPGTAASTRESHKRGARLRRLRLALKEMFTHHAVDESQFEHMPERHWTDE